MGVLCKYLILLNLFLSEGLFAADINIQIHTNGDLVYQDGSETLNGLCPYRSSKRVNGRYKKCSIDGLDGAIEWLGGHSRHRSSVAVQKTGKSLATLYNCRKPKNETHIRWDCRRAEKGPRKSKGFVSPFRSEVKGVSLPNASVFATGDNQAVLMRSMNPQFPSDIEGLVSAGIEKIILFKTVESSSSIKNYEMERASLVELSLDPDSVIHHIPFPYKSMENTAPYCKQSLDGLRVLSENLNEGVSTLLHCTVGEDRTGFLVALYRMLNNPKLDALTVFHESMCEYGFANGNPQKPDHVVQEIRESLTPLYIHMVKLIQSGKVTKDTIFDELSVCQDNAMSLHDIKVSSRFRCQNSTRTFFDYQVR